jgi:hypothetical protein
VPSSVAVQLYLVAEKRSDGGTASPVLAVLMYLDARYGAGPSRRVAELGRHLGLFALKIP